MADMNNDIEKVILTEAEIAEITKKIGAQITKDYEGKKLLVVGVLKGSFMFFADVVREIKEYCSVDFMVISSYGMGTESSGMLQIHKDLSVDVKGKDVLIIEDIVDSGITMQNVTGVLNKRGAASVKIATFLDKPSRRKVPVKADYVGCVVPDEFVVGYGLDFAEEYRNLPYLGVLKPEIYQK